LRTKKHESIGEISRVRFFSLGKPFSLKFSLNSSKIEQEITKFSDSTSKFIDFFSVFLKEKNCSTQRTGVHHRSWQFTGQTFDSCESRELARKQGCKGGGQGNREDQGEH